MASEIDSLIEQVAREKGLPTELILEALEESIVTAMKKKSGNGRVLEAHYQEDKGKFEIYQFKTVVQEPEDTEKEISIEDARQYDPNSEEGDEMGFKFIEVDKQELGRIGIQVVKQVFFQKLNEAKRFRIFAQFNELKGQILQGTIRRYEREGIIVEIGGYETLLPKEEQVRGESYRPGDQITVYISNVSLKDKSKPQSGLYRKSPERTRHYIVTVSRKDNSLVKALFERAVPEISEGIVNIYSIAREPGVRTKIAVYSVDPDVDPVGACVGLKGARVQSVIQDLRGEKIDIVPYSEDTVRFICNALAPANISKVIMNARTKLVEVVVPDDQLSLAIGKRGHNTKLAAILSGWMIDVKSETSMNRLNERAQKELAGVEELGSEDVEVLIKHGMRTLDSIAGSRPEDLAVILSIDNEKAGKIIKRAEELAGESSSKGEKESFEIIDDLEEGDRYPG